MKTTTALVSVCCMACRKATATHMIKDNACHIYPVCSCCKKSCLVRDSKTVAEYHTNPVLR